MSTGTSSRLRAAVMLAAALGGLPALAGRAGLALRNSIPIVSGGHGKKKPKGWRHGVNPGKPHQGARECARRRQQYPAGLDYHGQRAAARLAERVALQASANLVDEAA